MAAYPSPCDSCWKHKKTACHYEKCDLWLTRYRYRQKQINAYAKKVLPDYEERQSKWREQYEGNKTS